MSWSALEYVRKLHGLRVTEKAVLFALAYRDDDSHNGCWPSVKTLAADAGVSRTTAQTVIRALVKKELITITEHKRDDGSNSSNFYQFVALAPTNKEGVIVVRDGPRAGRGGQAAGPLEHTMNKEEDAARLGKVWDDLCANCHVVSAVDHINYWKTVHAVPLASIALERLLREFAGYNQNLRLVPGSVKRLEPAAEILASLDLSDDSFRTALSGIENPDFLQQLAKDAIDWAVGIRNSYGKVFA